MFRKNLLVIIALIVSEHAMAVELAGSVFESVGRKYNVDPYLLYSIALVESGTGRQKGISPWPWVIRSRSGGAVYATRKRDAANTLAILVENNPLRDIDVGMMQINLHWQLSRYETPEDLLDPEINLGVAAEYLVECIDSAPDDLIMGIGRYHIWTNELLARQYGNKVFGIYQNLGNTEGTEG